MERWIQDNGLTPLTEREILARIEVLKRERSDQAEQLERARRKVVATGRVNAADLHSFGIKVWDEIAGDRLMPIHHLNTREIDADGKLDRAL